MIEKARSVLTNIGDGAVPFKPEGLQGEDNPGVHARHTAGLVEIIDTQAPFPILVRARFEVGGQGGNQ